MVVGCVVVVVGAARDLKCIPVVLVDGDVLVVELVVVIVRCILVVEGAVDVEFVVVVDG